MDGLFLRGNIEYTSEARITLCLRAVVIDTGVSVVDTK